MISAISADFGRIEDGQIVNRIQYVGLSTDTKPTTNVANGSIFFEMNTGKIFMFNEAGDAWVEVQ
jgi:hypothetical protein